MPAEDASKEEGYQYPFVACQILENNSSAVLSAFFGNVDGEDEDDEDSDDEEKEMLGKRLANLKKLCAFVKTDD